MKHYQYCNYGTHIGSRLSSDDYSQYLITSLPHWWRNIDEILALSSTFRAIGESIDTMNTDFNHHWHATENSLHTPSRYMYLALASVIWLFYMDIFGVSSQLSRINSKRGNRIPRFPETLDGYTDPVECARHLLMRVDSYYPVCTTITLLWPELEELSTVMWAWVSYRPGRYDRLLHTY